MRQLVVMAVLLVLPAGPALGADDGEAREHYVKGTRAYELGLYEEAIAEYMAAYRLKDDPAFLFDLGQAHRLAKHPAEALHFYKRYLAKVPDAENRPEVESKIVQMTRLIELQAQPPPQQVPEGLPGDSSTAAPSGDISPAGAAPEGAASVHPGPAVLARTASVEARPAGRGLRIAGVATAAGGLALLGSGIVFGVLAKRAGDDLTRLDQTGGIFDPSKESAGQRDQILAGVFLGVGAAALAAGTIFYLWGARRAHAESHSVLVAPSVGAHAAGAILKTVF